MYSISWRLYKWCQNHPQSCWWYKNIHVITFNKASSDVLNMLNPSRKYFTCICFEHFYFLLMHNNSLRDHKLICNLTRDFTGSCFRTFPTLHKYATLNLSKKEEIMTPHSFPSVTAEYVNEVKLFEAFYYL